MSKPSLTKSLWPRWMFAICLVAVIVSLASPVQSAPTGARLRDIAGSSFLIGYASSNNFWTLSDATQYQDTARTEFNILTPENAMKWDATESSQNSFSFSQADQQVAFAQANNMKIHGHTLVWHSQLPGWVANGSWTSTTLTNVMYNHIDTVMNHWPDGTILAWDVVNEAFNDDGTRRSSVFQNVIGTSYIELAFRRARAADPTAKLIYNDYNIETINNKSTAVYNMVVDFINRGVPIDGIGLQMHLTNGGIDYTSLANNMQRFAALGLQIYITEMDVRFPTPLTQTDLTNQATIYRNVLNRCLAQAACKALQIWGFTDKYSWVPNTFSGQGGALIFDENYTAKLAYYALQAELQAKFGGGSTSTPSRTPTRTTTRSATPTRSNTPTGATPTPSRTATRTATPTPTATGQTATRSPTPSRSPAGGTGPACSPVTATITAPFTFDGAGTFCWQTSNLGTFINSWNMATLTVNGVNYTNLYAFTSALPAKINGYWYVYYVGNFAWSHFEAK